VGSGKSEADVLADYKLVANKYADAFTSIKTDMKAAVSAAQSYPRESSPPASEEGKKSHKDRRAKYESSKTAFLRNLKLMKGKQIAALLAVDIATLPKDAQNAAMELKVAVQIDLGTLEEIASLVNKTGLDRHVQYAAAERLAAGVGSSMDRVETVRKLKLRTTAS
jgi:hypothetical protein